MLKQALENQNEQDSAKRKKIQTQILLVINISCCGEVWLRDELIPSEHQKGVNGYKVKSGKG